MVSSLRWINTSKALKAYGVPDDAYPAGEESMYDMVRKMRSHIVQSDSFSGDKIAEQSCLKIPWIVQWMERALSVAAGMFGTKMRSVIKTGATQSDIAQIVEQQFKVGNQIIAAGLCPILEPEVDITAPDKEAMEDMLNVELLKGLDALDETQNVMLKLSLPTKVNQYKELIAHPRCVRLVALSGGYPRDEANEILSKQEGMIASFSRALLEGLAYGQSQDDFDKVLAATVDSIYQASKAP